MSKRNYKKQFNNFFNNTRDVAIGEIFKEKKKEQRRILMLTKNWSIRESSVIKRSTSQSQGKLKRSHHKELCASKLRKTKTRPSQESRFIYQVSQNADLCSEKFAN